MKTIDAAKRGAEGSTTGQERHGAMGPRASAARARLFRAARRHSWLVKSLRVLFPVGILLCFAAYGIIVQTQLMAGYGQFKPGKIEVTSDDLKMKNPSYYGVTSDKGKYEVRAREAAVDLAMSGPIRLEGIDGDLVQANGITTNLKATRGIFNRQNNELDMFDGVVVEASNGMRATTARAIVDTKSNRVVTNVPVRAEMPTGTLTANAMDFASKERLGKFRGNVALRLVQTSSQTPNVRPSIGLGGEARQPVDIRSNELDLDDNKSQANFRGSVVAAQGDSILKAPELWVVYEGQAAKQAGLTGAAAPTADTASQVSRLFARTGVTLTAGADRRIVADTVDFDVKSDSALFLGRVELIQARNSFRGGRLAVDRKAGKSRLDTPPTAPGAQPGRIMATLVQQAAEAGKAPTKAKSGAETPFGLRSDSGAPTDIEADVLEVNEAAKQAVFRGRVIAKQGDYTISAADLVAHYSGQSGLLASASDTAKPGAPSGAQLTSIETHGGTRIVAKDGREATAQDASIDVKANKVLLSGPQGVQLKQGNNEVNCPLRARMDLKTGEANCESPATVGTPQKHEPTPAELSIAAKPGVAPPAQPTACPPGGGRTCVIVYPEQVKQAIDSKGQSVSPSSPPVVIQKNKPAATPQTGASQVYRGN